MTLSLKLIVIYTCVLFPLAMDADEGEESMTAKPGQHVIEEFRLDEVRRNKVLLELRIFLGKADKDDQASVLNEQALHELRGSWRQAYQGGDFEKAVKQSQLEARLHLYLDDAELIGSLKNLGMSYQSFGNYKLAIGSLELALELAETVKNTLEQATVKGLLGSVYTFTRKANLAEPYLLDSLKIAQENNYVEVEAIISNDLGVVFASQAKGLQRDAEQLEDQKYYRKARAKNKEAISRFKEAINAYNKGYELARRTNNHLLMAKTMVNAAELSAQFKQIENCENFLGIAAHDVQKLSPIHETGFLLINLGKVYEQLVSAERNKQANERLELLTRHAYASYDRAREIGEAIGDQRSLCYSYGYMGGLYESQRRHLEALTLTRKAVFIAQQSRFSDLLYLWQWQTGRLLDSIGEVDSAIAAYERAIETLETIRHDVAISYGNRNTRSSFREEAGRVYVELADLLLHQLDDPESLTSNTQDRLQQICHVLERLKSAELEDYFQDDCVNLAQRKVQNSAPIADINTAAVYILPLFERSEIIVNFIGDTPNKTKPLFARETVKVSETELTKCIREFRLQLEDRTNPKGYLNSAQKLFQWIIQPIEELLNSRDIDTLVFIPDKALRTIPITALHDGDRFLIERYAIVLSPGMSLVDLSSSQGESRRLLLGGISKAVQGFRKLKYVPEELSGIQALYPEFNTTLENETFSVQLLRSEFQDQDYGMFHMATHGKVSRDVRDSYLLAYDGKLTLDDLEQLIRSNRLRGKEVDMLVLSACETAAGDERAALGLGGIAVKAGVSAAVATLWSIDDKITAELMISFYKTLKGRRSISKAKAMQLAQVSLIKHEIETYQHPSYWSPYLVIGNWL